ncbi:aldose epimerase family protein [Actinomycetes bacterium NPDC127524]
MEVKVMEFGEINGEKVQAYTIKNNRGMSITCLNYGCIITEIKTPDRSGKLENIVLGFDSIEEYIEHSPYFGAIVGRVAGRIKEGEFELDGTSYTLAKNDGNQHLHGGIKGFSNTFWNASLFEREDASGITFTRISADGEEGYPGNLKVAVTYSLNDENEFTIETRAETDQKTLINTTNHTYFNLSGEIKRNVEEHMLTLKSEQFLELDEELLPTGKLLDVEGTPFDFRKERQLFEEKAYRHPQNLVAGGGFDTPFCLSENNNREIHLADPESGRTLTIETNQPGVVVYTSNMLEGDFSIRGVKASNHLAICLETQGLPDAIHHSNFPSIVLDKNEEYRSLTKYVFSVQS